MFIDPIFCKNIQKLPQFFLSSSVEYKMIYFIFCFKFEEFRNPQDNCPNATTLQYICLKNHKFETQTFKKLRNVITRRLCSKHSNLEINVPFICLSEIGQKVMNYTSNHFIHLYLNVKIFP